MFARLGKLREKRLLRYCALKDAACILGQSATLLKLELELSTFDQEAYLATPQGSMLKVASCDTSAASIANQPWRCNLSDRCRAAFLAFFESPLLCLFTSP